MVEFEKPVGTRGELCTLVLEITTEISNVSRVIETEAERYGNAEIPGVVDGNVVVDLGDRIQAAVLFQLMDTVRTVVVDEELFGTVLDNVGDEATEEEAMSIANEIAEMSIFFELRSVRGDGESASMVLEAGLEEHMDDDDFRGLISRHKKRRPGGYDITNLFPMWELSDKTTVIFRSATITSFNAESLIEAIRETQRDMNLQTPVLSCRPEV